MFTGTRLFTTARCSLCCAEVSSQNLVLTNVSKLIVGLRKESVDRWWRNQGINRYSIINRLIISICRSNAPIVWKVWLQTCWLSHSCMCLCVCVCACVFVCVFARVFHCLQETETKDYKLWVWWAKEASPYPLIGEYHRPSSIVVVIVVFFSYVLHSCCYNHSLQIHFVLLTAISREYYLILNLHVSKERQHSVSCQSFV